MKRRITAGIAAAAAVLALSACSFNASIGGTTLVPEDIENLTTEQLSDFLPPGTEVSCPDDISADKDTTFQCTADIDGQTLTFDGTVTDDDGGVEVVMGQAVLDLTGIETQISDQLAEQLSGTFTMECAPDGQEQYYVSPVGDTFECTAEGTSEEGATETGQVTITTKDVEGNVDWAVN